METEIISRKSAFNKNFIIICCVKGLLWMGHGALFQKFPFSWAIVFLVVHIKNKGRDETLLTNGEHLYAELLGWSELATNNILFVKHILAGNMAKAWLVEWDPFVFEFPFTPGLACRARH